MTDAHTPRACKYCGKEFEPITVWQKCCPPGEKEADSCAYKLRKQNFKKWIATHPEQYAASRRAYNDRVREARRPYQAEYARKRRAADPEAHNTYIRERRHANPEHHTKVRAEWNAANPDKLKAYRKSGYARNAEKIKAASRAYTAKKRAALAAAWRPSDWMEKPIEWRIIGNELLSVEREMDNEELAERLDNARMLRCSYADSWGVITRRGAAAQFISNIRKWVRRPLE